MRLRSLVLFATLLLPHAASAADPGNRLAYLDEPPNPYYVGLPCAKFVTPQWVGEKDVELVIVLAIDDLGKPPVYEKFLRPVFERLKKIDGRAPVSIRPCSIDLWQLRSHRAILPSPRQADITIRFDPEVPLVTE